MEPVQERALGFGSVAEDYERYRLGYPADLLQQVLAYAARPLRTALEIGAGTGKATRLFAEAGLAVTASDPSVAMLAELRRHVPPTVTTVLAALEDLPLRAPDYDLVFAAASLHWTRPEGRWERIAALLAPGGVFASFGGQTELADPQLARAVEAARSDVLPSDDIPSPDGTAADARIQWPGTELQRSALFTDVRETTLPRRITVSARDCVGLLSTVSAYVVLPEPVRADVLRRILAVLPERVELSSDVVLHLARKA